MPLDPDLSPTRRQVIAGAAVTGVAVAAGGALAAPAMAAAPTDGAAPDNASEEPLVAHVRDPRTGEIDLYVGERHVSLRDRDLAARLVAAAR